MSDDNAHESSRGGETQGKWWIISAGVMVLVGLGLILILVSPGEKAKKAAPATTTVTVEPSGPHSTTGGPGSTGSQPTAPGPVVPGSWPDAGCNESSGPSTVPTSAPSGVAWEPVGAMSVPTSSNLGPRKKAGYLRQCFQHSPAGAVLAATNILQGSSVAGRGSGPTVFKAQMTPGPGRDSAIADAASPETGPGTASPAGFQLGACTPAACQVNLLLFGQGFYLQASLPMVWTAGDWYVNGQAADLTNMSLTQAAPGGYVSWHPGS